MRFAPACTPSQEATLKRDTIARTVKALTGRDVLTLRQGVQHPTGNISPVFGPYGSTERRMAKLVTAGLVTANAHGDWDITDFGRAVVSAING